MNILLFLLLSVSSWSGDWISVKANRENKLYIDGEEARFSVRLETSPTNPGFEIKVAVEQLGEAAPVNIGLTSGVGTFVSPVLETGSPIFRFTAQIEGPGGWMRILEQQDIRLQVNSEYSE